MAIDFRKLIDEKIAENMQYRPRFDILYVSDDASRLAFTRGLRALEEFKTFYGGSGIANVSIVSMDSKRFVDIKPDLSNYTVVWVDNVANAAFNSELTISMRALLHKLVPDFADEYAALEGDAREEFAMMANKYRAQNCRIVYALDEYVWEAPVGRAKNIITVKVVEDAMSMSDCVVVPNAELGDALTEIGFVTPDKEVLVLPTFMSDTFYPVNKIFEKSSSMASNIRKPRILIKGTEIPMNVQKFIIDGFDKYDITVCSVGELCKTVMKLLEKRVVKNLQHWANPAVTYKNAGKTAAIERDAAFDFVILTVPTDVENDIYNITNVDNDALMAIASGAVAFAGVDDVHYGKGMHICVETGLTFGKDTEPKRIAEMVGEWSICSNWDEAYSKQRELLKERLISSQSVQSGFFHIMIGREESEARQQAAKTVKKPNFTITDGGTK